MRSIVIGWEDGDEELEIKEAAINSCTVVRLQENKGDTWLQHSYAFEPGREGSYLGLRAV